MHKKCFKKPEIVLANLITQQHTAKKEEKKQSLFIVRGTFSPKQASTIKIKRRKQILKNKMK